MGEELGVLPGMDSIFSALALERLIGFLGYTSQQNRKDKYDVIVYDGISAEETIRMVGASSKARLYLKYLRNLAEKTDLGRLAGPSLLRLAEESINLSGKGSQLNGRMSSEIWDSLEQMLERGASMFLDPNKFGCYLVMDTKNPISVNSALRFWGCVIQAGAQVSGALGIASPDHQAKSKETVQEKVSPLPFSLMPNISIVPPPDWKSIMQQKISEEAREILSQESSRVTPPVEFDVNKKTITLLVPGFDKSEIKLFQVLSVYLIFFFSLGMVNNFTAF